MSIQSPSLNSQLGQRIQTVAAKPETPQVELAHASAFMNPPGVSAFFPSQSSLTASVLTNPPVDAFLLKYHDDFITQALRQLEGPNGEKIDEKFIAQAKRASRWQDNFFFGKVRIAKSYKHAGNQKNYEGVRKNIFGYVERQMELAEKYNLRARQAEQREIAARRQGNEIEERKWNRRKHRYKRKKAQAFGRAAHTVADFYAHSKKYIELALEHFDKAEDIPTFDEVLANPKKYQTFHAILKKHLNTATFSANPFSWRNRGEGSHTKDHMDNPKRPGFDLAYKLAARHTKNLAEEYQLTLLGLAN